ncbi:hypothetical protein [Planktotalea arctica]|uniref:hypothetical protein n=1 Tax=Planktotalea arctica TaxID=1481893 RepID=UPI003219C53D
MRRVLSAVLAGLCSSVAAEPLADMQGAWSGSGWARETPEGPKETVRCRMENTYESNVLTVSGRCVAAGQKLALAGEIKGKAASEQITGHWFNPDGLGFVRISGVRRGAVIAFTFAAIHPETGVDIAQNVEWRVGEQGLRLRASDRTDPRITMSDIAFTR